MEVKGGKDNKLVVCLYEIMGTALLLLTINWGTPEAIAGMIFIGTVLFGPISGGHFNPAVTIGVLITQDDALADNIVFALMIMVSEITGGFIGCLLARSAYIADSSGKLSVGFISACPGEFFRSNKFDPG